MSRVYIASGFFNADQMQKVKDLESHYDSVKVDYFSPRTFVMDLNPKNPDRMNNARILFNKDIEEINNCSHMHAIIDNTYDIGTLFEVGYYLGLVVKGKRYLCDLNCDRKEVMELANYFIRFMNNISVKDQIDEPILVFDNDIIDRSYRFAIKSHYRNYADVGSKSNFVDNLKFIINSRYTPIILIDDKPWKLFIFMGILYCMSINYFTTSFKDYGSNIMIACSALAHIRSIVIDNDYSNVKIE